MIPAISVSQGKPTMFFPLVIVVLVSMVKDFFQDWKRKVSDRRENFSQIQVLGEIGFAQIKWESILVGNIIMVNKDQYFPCDVLLLRHGQQSKFAYVETKNLDGETNLKLKKVPQQLSFLQKQPINDLYNTNIEILYQKPNPFISSFNGNLKLHNVPFPLRQKKHPLDSSNIILRGCSLKINSFAMGLCLYNGHQSKIMMNASQSSPKKSSLQNILNRYFKYICIFQVSSTLLFSLIYGAIVSINYVYLGYAFESADFFVDAVSVWGSWIICISNFIPISLLVTVEMIRYGQGYLLNRDPNCGSKGFNVEVQTSSVNEELGQIQYVLSDKTGTLTQNKMEFKCICIGNTNYGIVETKDYIEQPEKSLITDISSPPQPSTFLQIQKQALQQYKLKKQTKYVDFNQQQKIKLINNLQTQISKDGVEGSIIYRTLLHLALCHNVIVEDKGKKQEEEGEGEQYSSSSPDQLALVCFGRYLGFGFRGKDDDGFMVVKVGMETHKFKLLHTLQFSSQRKRMSVIVEDAKGNILLLCKGADDIIIQRSQCTDRQQSQLNQHLCKYALQGLRTLVLAYRQLSLSQYQQWNIRYQQAITVVSQDRMQKIYDLQSEIQKNLTILGATAIQDKLQEYVKETIQDLKRSSMKVWMLTGDKKETAVSIGYSCGLIGENSEKITLDCEPEHAEYLINNVQSMLHMLKGQKVTIISGQILRKISDQTLQKLSSLLKISSSVICCRVSPKDKQTLTRMVKKWGRTLAVGDGANDVNMINAANVGVGVKGIQGSQATRAADYVISQFRILNRLVVYYGSNFYYRNAHVILYNLYKNILITFPLLAYGPLSMLSATYIYQTWIFQFFNLLFSSVPIILFGLTNTKHNQQSLQTHPTLYQKGQKNTYFNMLTLLRLVLCTSISGILIVFVTYYGNQLVILGQGFMGFQIWSGMMVFNVVVCCVNVRIYGISNQVSLGLGIASVFSLVSYYLIFFFVQIILYSDCKNVLKHQLASVVFWLLLILQVFAVQSFQWTWTKLTTNSLRTGTSTKQLHEQKNKNQQIEISHTYSVEQKDQYLRIQSPKKMKKDLGGGKQNSGGYAFAEDQRRSLQVL